MKITLFLPTLNEIKGMEAIIPRIKKEWFDEIILVDGGSTDGTVEYAKQQGFKVHHQTSKGITGAYEEVIQIAQGDVVVAFSPDGNSVPEMIPSLIQKMKEGYDMVIVSRYLKGAQSEDDSWVTAFGNWMFTYIINILFGGKYTDSLVIFRAWRKDIIQKFPKNVPRAGFETLSSIRCAKYKMKVTEIPGDEPSRIGGVRKMNPFLNGLDILKLIAMEFITKKKVEVSVVE
ncbi:MAG: glycosyltransferase family 2 protein [Deltaproteobacteria bacterium]|nr:glycosyltransferase family 2 protein [Deltaproteobacteria bacterium]